jgi:hypothetical protein
MASAVFERESAPRAVRAAIRARRAKRQLATGPCGERNWDRSARGVWRGVGASAAIGGGYVALVTGLRWILVAVG